MSLGYRISCESCYYSYDFFLGVGALTPFYEHTLSTLHPMTRKRIERLIGNETINHFESEGVLIECQRCNHLYDRAYMNINYGDNQTLTTGITCSKCNGKGRIIEDLEKEISGLCCPSCKRKTLFIDSHILWD